METDATTVTEAEAVLLDMERSVDELEAEVAAVIGRRSQYALASAQGDTIAKKHLARLTDLETARQAKLRDARLAVEAAGVQLADARSQADAADLAARQAAYAEAAAIACEAATEIDRGAEIVVAAYAKLREAHRAMVATHIVNPALNRLIFRQYGSVTLAAHGVRGFL